VPVEFLSDQEAAGFGRYGESVSSADLERFFFLDDAGCRGFWNGIRRWRAFPQFIALFGLDEWGVNCLHSSGR
jgi:hypothetical protein